MINCLNGISMEAFSTRSGYMPEEKTISIRDEAPESLRSFVLLTAKSYFALKQIRDIVCSKSYSSPDANNWAENSYMESEIERLLSECDWPYVYDIIEALYENLNSLNKQAFSEQINKFFVKNGFGWLLSNGLITYRGEAPFENIKKDALHDMEIKGLDRSKTELEESIKDLSARPKPDLTGSIQHALAALECAIRRASDDDTHTLGELVKRHPDLFPQALGEAVKKIWGFASENGRHVREGKSVDKDVAELLVGLSCSLCGYISKRLPIKDNSTNPWFHQ